MKKKILVYGLNFSPEIVGIGKYTTELVDWLYKKNHNLKIISACPYFPRWETKKNGYSKELKNQGYEIYRCPIFLPKKITALSRILHLLSFLISSFPIVISQYFWKPDIIITIVPSFFSTQNALLLNFLMNFKPITLLHYQDLEIDAAFQMGFLKNKFLKKLLFKWEKKTISKFDYVSTISRRMLKKILEKNLKSSKALYLPNWVDTSEIFPIENSKNNSYRKQLKITEEKIIFMYSGSMNEKQGIELLAALASHQFNNKNILWIFSGEGPSKRKLVAQTSHLENVIICPLQPLSRINEWINLADVHIIPQKDEASDLVLPSKLMAILSSGKPFITTTSPDSEMGLIAKNAGIVVYPHNNLNELINAVELLASNPSLRKKLGNAARKIAKNNFDKKKILSEFLSILNL